MNWNIFQTSIKLNSPHEGTISDFINLVLEEATNPKEPSPIWTAESIHTEPMIQNYHSKSFAERLNTNQNIKPDLHNRLGLNPHSTSRESQDLNTPRTIYKQDSSKIYFCLDWTHKKNPLDKWNPIMKNKTND